MNNTNVFTQNGSRWRRSFNQDNGFSLIELMIVLVLLAIIVLKAVPFTTDWVNGARVTDAQSVLVEAVGLAKSKALRNSVGIIEGKAVTAICLNNGFLDVLEASNDTTPVQCTGSTRIWRADIANNVNVKVAGSGFNCLCFDAKAQFTQQGGYAACLTTTVFDLTAGGINEVVEVY